MTAMQFGSYVFPHNPRKIELSFSNSISTHLQPSRGVLSQNLGKRARVVRCEGELFAATADAALAQLNTLSGACSSSAAATLYLPAGGQFSAYVSRFGFAAQGDGRIISYYVEFIECEGGGS